MGTTMAYYYIKNDGFDREGLQAALGSLSGRESASAKFEKMMIGLVGEEMFRQAQQQVQATQQHFDSVFGARPKLPSPMVAYRPDAAWLPFFDVDVCEGYNATSRDARKLSKVFGAPVLAFSIFDSDILMVSYCDAAKGVRYDCARPNMEGMEEYDTQTFRNERPAFLLELCPALTREKLTEIWEGDEVFADDRMDKLGEVLGLSPVSGMIPEGFEVIAVD